MRSKIKKHELSNNQLWQVLRRALPELMKSAPLLVSLMLLSTVIGGMMPALNILISKWTVDGVTAIAAGNEANLTVLAVAWVCAALLGQLAQMGRSVLQGYVVDHFTIQTVSQLMIKMRELAGLDVLEDPQFHDDIEILQLGARRRPLNLLAASLALLSDGIAALTVAATLFVVAWWMPFVVLIGMLPLAKKQVELYKLGWGMMLEQTQESRELSYDQRVAMRHEYAKEVRVYHLLPYIQERYLKRAVVYQRTIRGVRNKQLLGTLPQQILMLLVAAGAFIYVVHQAGLGLLTAGSVVLVVSAIGQLRRHLEELSMMLSSMTEHLHWFGKYHDFLDAQPAVTQPKEAVPVPSQLDIRLDDVTFGYRDHPPVLENVSLTIPEGQVVAIVGENGAGKTTLVKLLLRFYDPRSGHILLGPEQTNLRDVDLEAWRGQIAAVFQDFARFEWTLRENVLLGQPEEESKLQTAVTSSGLQAALGRVENGLDARIGQAFGGIDLSGGQWQKLATARALYRNARILILDEPTAALDPRSEAEVYSAFAALAKGRTTLLITHRLGSVQMADRILVMQMGRLIEDGTHTELLAKGGEYAELWRLQAQQYSAQAIESKETSEFTNNL